MLAAVALLLAAGPAAAPPCTVGDWVMKVGETPLWGLRIGNAATGLTATWARPERSDLDGDSFSDVRGPVVERPLQSARIVDGDLELTFDDPRPNATPDIFRATCDRGGHLKVAYVEVRFEPFDFAKASAHDAPLGGWQEGRTYARAIDRPTNAEMVEIFAADQADRRSDHIDWSVVGPRDEQRRARRIS